MERAADSPVTAPFVMRTFFRTSKRTEENKKQSDFIKILLTIKLTHLHLPKLDRLIQELSKLHARWAHAYFVEGLI